MVLSLIELESPSAETWESLRTREKTMRHRTLQEQPADERMDFTLPAFSPWWTAAQMVFAVAFTILGLGLVLASIVAITRA